MTKTTNGDHKVKSNLIMSKDLATSLALLLAYSLVILHPIYNHAIVQERLFSNDIAQYLLTAMNIIEGRENLFNYPYPLVPTIYLLPSMLIKDPLALYTFGLFVSGFLTIFVLIAFHIFVKGFSKTKISKIISTAFFGANPLLLDTIGWGGQSTLIAILCGLISLTFLLSYLKSWENKYFIFSLVFLSLSITSEPFISGYFVITEMLIFLIMKAKGLTQVKKSSFIVLILIPLSQAAILWFLNRERDVSVPPFLGLYIVSDPDILHRILDRVTFHHVIMLFSFTLIILTYLVIRIASKRKNGVADLNAIIEATGLALVAIVLMTPAQFADRGAALYSIPLALMLVDIVDYLTSKNAQTRVYHEFLAVATIFFTLLSFGIGFNIYHGSLEFYYIDKELLEFTSFLSDESGEILFISPKHWVFSLAYITGKNVFATAQPVWFIFRPQIEASITAMTLAWGTRWIDAGEVKVVDSTPAGPQPSPAIYVAKYPYYVELFRLSDGLLPIAFSPAYNESIIWHESPFYARRITAWVSTNAMHSLYEYETLIINKTTSIDDGGEVSIMINYRFINSFPRRIGVRLISLMLKETEARILYDGDRYARVNIIQTFKEPWLKLNYNTIVECWTAGDATLTVEYVRRNEWGLPEIKITATPITYTDNVTITLKIKVLDVSIRTPHVVVQDDVVKDKNIKWVVIDKEGHPDIVLRFRRDHLYEEYAESRKYIILRVKHS